MRRVIRSLIVIITVVIMVLYYHSQYDINRNNLALGLTETLGEDLKLLGILDSGDLFVRYETFSQQGYVHLNKGLFNRYRLQEGTSGSKDHRILMDNIILGGETLVLYGDFDQVASIRIDGRDVLEVELEDTSGLVLVPTDMTRASIIGFMLTYQNGKEVYEKEPYEITNAIRSPERLDRGNATMVYLVLMLIAIGGIILVSYAAPGINKLEKIYFRWTKDEVRRPSEDPNDYTMTDTMIDR